MQPKVSVVIPVYNVEQYLQNCIDSLVNQTLQEIELIFVNDASPDNSLAILRENEQKYPDKIVVIDSMENLRQGGARNIGIRAARAPYIGFVDSDDFVNFKMYETMYRRIDETNADVVYVQASMVPDTATLQNVSKCNLQPFVTWSDNRLHRENVIITDVTREPAMLESAGGVWSGLWRKSMIVDNELWFPECLKYEDNYWGSLAECYIKKESYVHEILYYYRSNPTSTTHKRNTSEYLDRIKIENMLLSEAKKRGLFERYYQYFEYVYIQRYALNTYYTFISKYDEPPIDAMNRVKNDLYTNFPAWKKNKYFKKSNAKEVIKSRLLALPPQWVAALVKMVKGR